MKKIIPFFMLFVMVISLCACSGGKNSVKFTPKLNSPFNVSAKIDYNDTESEAVIKRYGKANWDVEFSSPNTLSGVVLSYRDDKVEASYKGLSFSVPKSALPIKSIISSLIEVVDTTAEMPEVDAVENEGMMEITGELEQGKYILTLDKNGGLAEFDMPNLNLEIDFTDFRTDTAATPVTTVVTTQPKEQVTTIVTTTTTE